jgi:hypothetical protein
MNDLDRHNLAELTKSGQPATATGTLPAQEQALARSFLPGPGAEYAARLAAADSTRRAVLMDERGKVAFEVARGLGFNIEVATRYERAAIAAAAVGLEVNPRAGRVSIGTSLGGWHSLSIVGPTGALYDPTRAGDPGNSLVGSD